MGVSFVNQSLIEQAVRHPSRASETSGLTRTDCNGRLEFFGDAVLSHAIGLILYRAMPAAAEGKLTEVRAKLVNGDSVADCARTLGLGEFLFLVHGEEVSGGRDRKKNLEGALEAVIGAVCLDQGFEAARGLVDRIFGQSIERLTKEGAEVRDAKSVLQEYAQAKWAASPTYDVLRDRGEDGEYRFGVQAVVGSRVLAGGVGSTRRGAEQDAAQTALRRLGFPATPERS